MKKRMIPIALAGGVILSGTVNTHVAMAASPADVAKEQLHTPYQWGQNDCSGFTKKVFAKFGVDLPHSSVEQARFGIPVSKNNLRPGDLVFFNTSGNGISHVGIYVGGGWMINSENEKTGVRETQIFGGGLASYWEPRFVTGRRIDSNASDGVKNYEETTKTTPDSSLTYSSQNTELVNQKTNYIVNQGDTLSEISLRVHVSVSELRALNGISDDLIKAGQMLRFNAGHAQQKKRSATPLAQKTLMIKAVLDKNTHASRSVEHRTSGTPTHIYNTQTNSLWAILSEHGITVWKYQKLNHQDTIRLFPGQKLFLQ
ncbi:MAG: LysM peptidoglycan-binding protein [Sporolactobacillus laevolacticus]|jgi:LysM repeat protein|nr:LysM peptidoglycan-binding protein [Sporolactobacillus laevolacticus]